MGLLHWQCLVSHGALVYLHMVEVPRTEQHSTFLAAVRIDSVMRFATVLLIKRSFTTEPAFGTTNSSVFLGLATKIIAKEPTALQLLSEGFQRLY